MSQSTKNNPLAPAPPPLAVPSGCLAAFRRPGWVGSGWVSPGKRPTLQSRRTRASGGPEGSGNCRHPNGKTSWGDRGTKTQEVCGKEGASCSQGSPHGSPASPPAAGQEGIELGSHLAGEGQVAVLSRTVGEDGVVACRERESCGSGPGQFAQSQGGPLGKREGVCSQPTSSQSPNRHPRPR